MFAPIFYFLNSIAQCALVSKNHLRKVFLVPGHHEGQVQKKPSIY